MDLGDLKARAAAVRLPVKDLARLAGLNKHTVHNAWSGRSDSLTSTRDKLGAALVGEERRMLDHLLALHGVPQREDDGAPADAVKQ